MKKVIVTGGAGFIGSHIVERLAKEGKEVIVVDDLSSGKLENIPEGIEYTFVQCDLASDDFLRTAHLYFEDVDVIFHLAAKARVQPSIEDPVTYHDSNVTGTHNLLVAAKTFGVTRVVFSSTSAVYGNTAVPTTELNELDPMSPYALHKLIGEQYCRLFTELYGIDTVSLRYFNVYGDRMSLDGAYRLAIPIFAEQIKNGESCTVNNDGNQRRDFIYVEDVVNANIAAATHALPFKGEAFNIGNGNNVSVNELVALMDGTPVYGQKVIEPFETLADIRKAYMHFGWQPTGDLRSWIDNYMKTYK